MIKLFLLFLAEYGLLFLALAFYIYEKQGNVYYLLGKE